MDETRASAFCARVIELAGEPDMATAIGALSAGVAMAAVAGVPSQNVAAVVQSLCQDCYEPSPRRAPQAWTGSDWAKALQDPALAAALDVPTDAWRRAPRLQAFAWRGGWGEVAGLAVELGTLTEALRWLGSDSAAFWAIAATTYAGTPALLVAEYAPRAMRAELMPRFVLIPAEPAGGNALPSLATAQALQRTSPVAGPPLPVLWLDAEHARRVAPVAAQPLDELEVCPEGSQVLRELRLSGTPSGNVLLEVAGVPGGALLDVGTLQALAEQSRELVHLAPLALAAEHAATEAG